MTPTRVCNFCCSFAYRFVIRTIFLFTTIWCFQITRYNKKVHTFWHTWIYCLRKLVIWSMKIPVSKNELLLWLCKHNRFSVKLNLRQGIHLNMDLEWHGSSVCCFNDWRIFQHIWLLFLRCNTNLNSITICYDLCLLFVPGASDIVQKCGYQAFLKSWSSVYSFSPVMLTQWERQIMLVNEWHQVNTNFYCDSQICTRGHAL